MLKNKKKVLLLKHFSGVIKEGAETSLTENDPTKKGKNFIKEGSDKEDKGKQLKVSKSGLWAEPPLGILYLHTYAKTKLPEIDFDIIDGQALLIENIEEGMEFCWQSLLKQISDIKPDLIAIGSYFFLTGKIFHETCKRLKDCLPDIPILAGGNYPTDAPEVVLKDKNIDYIIQSEGELAFVEFVRNFFDGGDLTTVDGIGYRDKIGKIHISKKRIYIDDFKNFPIPDRSVLPMEVYGKGRSPLDRILPEYKALSMTISRGCPFVCTFCSATQFWGRRIRYRETKDVLDEMQILKEEYGATAIVIDDDNFLVNKKQVTSILEGMIERKLDLKWICGSGSMVKIIDKDDKFLDLLIRSGYAYFNLAIESSNDATLKRIKKPLEIRHAVSLINKLRDRYPHMYVNAFFIVGFPFETTEDIKSTLKFSEDLELDWATHQIYFSYPNTELFDYSVDNDYIERLNLKPGEIYSPQEISGDEWSHEWVIEKNYLSNLRANYVYNRNLKNGNYEQALRDFEYVISRTNNHALAYNKASKAAELMGLTEKARSYSTMEKQILSDNDNEFHKWYDLLSIEKPCIESTKI